MTMQIAPLLRALADPTRLRIMRLLAHMELAVGELAWSEVSDNLFIGESGNNCPVEYVNWEDAQEFVRRLNAKTGKVCRLPSEAEWEYACRAGGRDEYCGGNNLDAVGWYRANSSGKTQAVAGKQANAWGLYDMNGNVWELTQECWSERHSGAPNDGTVRAGGDCSYRVVRGASWSDSPQSVRTTNRNRNAVSGRFNDSGFRLARTLAP